MIDKVKSSDDWYFNEFLILEDDAQGAIVQWLAPLINKWSKRTRKIEGFCNTVGLVIANVLASEGRDVFYSRQASDYSGNQPYKPAWLGYRRLLGVIDGLEKEGLLEGSRGRWGGTFSKGIRSTFKPTAALEGGLAEREIGYEAVTRNHKDAPVIVLKDGNKERVWYDINDEWVAQIATDLKGYNAFLAEQDITLPGRKTPTFYGLRRVYNDGKWNRGGRHFGGWWQDLNKIQRSAILINGRETVEYDFAGFMTRAIYHMEGIDFRADPYDIPKVRAIFQEEGIDWDAEGRDTVKKIINILLNIKSQKKIYYIKRKEFPDLNIPLKRIVPLILDFHHRINDFFFKDTSSMIMNIESDICHKIIVKGMSDGIAILPIFDGFIVDKKYKEYLMELMISLYHDELSFYPVIRGIER